VSNDSTATAVLESDVIRRAQEGDAGAFATLFHTHKTRVYSLCLRILCFTPTRHAFIPCVCV
jgi:hypothetical protein